MGAPCFSRGSWTSVQRHLGPMEKALAAGIQFPALKRTIESEHSIAASNARSSPHECGGSHRPQTQVAVGDMGSQRQKVYPLRRACEAGSCPKQLFVLTFALRGRNSKYPAHKQKEPEHHSPRPFLIYLLSERSRFLNRARLQL